MILKYALIFAALGLHLNALCSHTGLDTLLRGLFAQQQSDTPAKELEDINKNLQALIAHLNDLDTNAGMQEIQKYISDPSALGKLQDEIVSACLDQCHNCPIKAWQDGISTFHTKQGQFRQLHMDSADTQQLQGEVIKLIDVATNMMQKQVNTLLNVQSLLQAELIRRGHSEAQTAVCEQK